MTPEREPERSDVELVHAVAGGDESAFAALYDRYSSILLGLLLRILHSRPEAEDVLQEVFLQVWQQASNFDASRGRPFTWLVTLARSRAIDRLRATQSRDRVALKASGEASSFSVGDAADDVVLRSEQRDIVQGALAQLPEEQRRTLLLAYLDGLTQSEIARRLGQPLGTVKTRTRSGLMKLHELLHKQVSGLGRGDR